MNLLPRLKKLFGFNTVRTLNGDGTWAFDATVEGNDIVVRCAKTTWFGGANDPNDNGETASGLNTKRHPTIKGCALPMNFGPCAGSPLPRLPWMTKVEVTHALTGKTITVPLIDLGPGHRTGAALDLTQPAFKDFGELRIGVVTTDYRILGGAKYLPA